MAAATKAKILCSKQCPVVQQSNPVAPAVGRKRPWQAAFPCQLDLGVVHRQSSKDEPISPYLMCNNDLAATHFTASCCRLPLLLLKYAGDGAMVMFALLMLTAWFASKGFCWALMIKIVGP
jgi:hypothetical protein